MARTAVASCTARLELYGSHSHAVVVDSLGPLYRRTPSHSRHLPPSVQATTANDQISRRLGAQDICISREKGGIVVHTTVEMVGVDVAWFLLRFPSAISPATQGRLRVRLNEIRLETLLDHLVQCLCVLGDFSAAL